MACAKPYDGDPFYLECYPMKSVISIPALVGMGVLLTSLLGCDAAEQSAQKLA